MCETHAAVPRAGQQCEGPSWGTASGLGTAPGGSWGLTGDGPRRAARTSGAKKNDLRGKMERVGLV